MSSKVVNIEPFQAVADALNTYRTNFSQRKSILYRAIGECRENLDRDVYSFKCCKTVEEGLVNITVALEKMEKLETDIRNRIQEMKDAEQIVK